MVVVGEFIHIILKMFCFFWSFCDFNLPSVFFCRVLFDTRQAFAECPKKVLGKELFVDKCLTSIFCQV
jgi:hypothetical protein